MHKHRSCTFMLLPTPWICSISYEINFWEKVEKDLHTSFSILSFNLCFFISIALLISFYFTLSVYLFVSLFRSVLLSFSICLPSSLFTPLPAAFSTFSFLLLCFLYLILNFSYFYIPYLYCRSKCGLRQALLLCLRIPRRQIGLSSWITFRLGIFSTMYFIGVSLSISRNCILYFILLCYSIL